MMILLKNLREYESKSKVMESLKYILLLLLVPEVLSGNISKEQLLDEMVKLGLTEEEKNELLKQVKEE